MLGSWRTPGVGQRNTTVIKAHISEIPLCIVHADDGFSYKCSHPKSRTYMYKYIVLNLLTHEVVVPGTLSGYHEEAQEPIR